MAEETITLKWMLYKNTKIVTLQTSYDDLRYWGILDFYKDSWKKFDGYTPKKVTREQFNLKTRLFCVYDVTKVTFTPLGIDILFRKDITRSFYKIEPRVNNIVREVLSGNNVVIQSPTLR